MEEGEEQVVGGVDLHRKLDLHLSQGNSEQEGIKYSMYRMHLLASNSDLQARYWKSACRGPGYEANASLRQGSHHFC